VKDKDLIQALREILKKNLTSEAGSAILEQMARSKSNLEERVVTVLVYDKVDSDSWLPFVKPLHEFSFATHEYELAMETMKAYDAEEFDVSVTFGNISKQAMNAIQMAPYFEFISSQAPLDNILSGTKSEYIGEA
jgi:hypothetical protein